MLTMERIEAIPLRVPLPFTYSWSHDPMRNRCTVATPVNRSAGIVGIGGHCIPDSPEAKGREVELSR
jgi:hypothetical protein